MKRPAVSVLTVLLFWTVLTTVQAASYPTPTANRHVSSYSSADDRPSRYSNADDRTSRSTYHAPLYFSDDEQEERILSALADLDESKSPSQLDTTAANNYVYGYCSDDTSSSEENLQSHIYTRHSRALQSRQQWTTPRAVKKEPVHVSRPEHCRANATATQNAAAASSNIMPATTTLTATATLAEEPGMIPFTTPWVRHFLASCPRDVLLPVPRDYLQDTFNFANLAPVVEKVALQRDAENQESVQEASGKAHPIYRQALRLVLQDELWDPDSVPEVVQRAAKVLYLLIHQRYVISPRGLDTVRRRFLLKAPVQDDPIFGRCPRLPCRGMPLLPYGDSDNYQVHGTRDDRAKRYCASCGQGFYLWESRLDGCAWGTSFCHLFLLTCGDEVFGDWKRQASSQSAVSSSRALVVPGIFGFQLHPSIQKKQISWQGQP